ncbi:hypothetical protein CA85_44560 [Allorhodopirellula solitaria]|uniref:Uncharacterized protein n=2 Tax=Allorhodopirellula solitaria TaxID=2527987 RepID=A0A5C5WZ81_9BACT|nr:hypothetical protein CA85_44560 [Allorhodopirellula solitaria]
MEFNTDPEFLRERWHSFTDSPLRDPAGSDTYNVLTLFRSWMLGAVLGGLAAMFLKCLPREEHAARGAIYHPSDILVIGVLELFVVAVELGQLLEPSRTCSMLSALVQQAGVVVGYLIVQNISVAPSVQRVPRMCHRRERPSRRGPRGSKRVGNDRGGVR